MTLFLVPRDAPGVSVRGYPKIDGGRAAEVSFENVILGDDALLGAAGEGFATLEYAIACGVLALCSEAVGAMDVAKDYTLDYLRTRKQFGVAIGSFQCIAAQNGRHAARNRTGALSGNQRRGRVRCGTQGARARGVGRRNTASAGSVRSSRRSAFNCMAGSA